MVEKKIISLSRKVRHYLTKLYHLAIGKIDPEGNFSENVMTVEIRIDRKNRTVIAAPTHNLESLCNGIPNLYMGPFVNTYMGSEETWDVDVSTKMAVIGLVKLIGAGLMNAIGDVTLYMRKYQKNANLTITQFKQKMIVDEKYVLGKPGVKEGGRYQQISQGINTLEKVAQAVCPKDED